MTRENWWSEISCAFAQEADVSALAMTGENEEQLVSLSRVDGKTLGGEDVSRIVTEVSGAEVYVPQIQGHL